MPSSLSTFLDPPTEFSVLPFWFWNDDLDADEIRRQIADFEEHGVHGFIIHPRVGLPRTLGWMSEALLEFYDVAIEEAGRRGMRQRFALSRLSIQAALSAGSGDYPTGATLRAGVCRR